MNATQQKKKRINERGILSGQMPILPRQATDKTAFAYKSNLDSVLYAVLRVPPIIIIIIIIICIIVMLRLLWKTIN